MDVSAACRLLHGGGRRRMFDSTSVSLNTYMLLVDNDPAPIRARRYIPDAVSKRRYRVSGDPSSSSPSRPVLDRRWTFRNTNDFAVRPASRRGYAWRQPRSPPSKEPPPPSSEPGRRQAGSVPKPADGESDFVYSPHKMSGHAVTGRRSWEQLETAQKDLRQEQEAHNRIKEALEHTNAKLKEAEDGRVADQRKAEDERLIGQQRAKDERLADQQRMEERAREQQRDFDARYQRVYSEAYDGAKLSVLQELEKNRSETQESLQSARRHEEESVLRAKALKEEAAAAAKFLLTQKSANTQFLTDAKARQGQEARQELREQWQEKERDLEKRFAKEQRRLNQAGESRQHERATYTDYRSLWRRLGVEVRKLSSHLLLFQELADREVILWGQTMKNFNPESIEPWFPQRYRKLTQQLQEMHVSKLQQAEHAAGALKDLRNKLEDQENEVQMSGHYSRRLTRHHRYGDDQTAAQSISLCLEFLNEAPLAHRRVKVGVELRSLEKQIASMTPSTRREHLVQSLAFAKEEISLLLAMSAYFYSLRDAETLKVLLHSSPRIQETHLRLRPLKEPIVGADRAWAAHNREQAQSRGGRTGKDEKIRKDEFLETMQRLKARYRNHERSIRKRQLLEESLGEPVSENDRSTGAQTLARAKADAESNARARLRELVASRQGRNISTTLRPLTMTSRATEIAINPSDTPKQVASKFERQTWEIKRRIASASSSEARTRINKELREHKQRIMRWEDQRRRAKEKRAEDSATTRDGEQKATRQDGDVSAANVTPAKETDTSPVTNTKPRGRKIPGRRLILSAKSKSVSQRDSRPAPNTPDAGATGRGAGLNVRPTEAKQAAHVFWPTFSSEKYAEVSTGSHSKAMSTFSVAASAEVARDDEYTPADGASRPCDPSQPSSSQSSQSSYQPSGRPETRPLNSQPVASDLIESSDTDNPPQLRYHMSAADHRTAAMASPNTAAAYWTHKLYKNSEQRHPPVYYCTTLEQAETRAKEFSDDAVIGFDIEWEMRHSPGKSGIKKNVSLIQIAADDKIALFHLAVFKGETIDELMPPSLRSILESRDVVKAGVNIQGDAWRLSECLEVVMTGIFELSHLYRVVTFSDRPDQINRRPFKLADQVQDVLLLPLKKDAVRTSAWSKKLDMQQTEYAASDAYAGFRLFHALEAKRKMMDPMPPRPAFYEEHKPIQLGDGTLIQAKSRKKAVPAGGKKPVEADEEEEEEEFFDAVENLDAYDLGHESTKSAGVPLAGLTVSYPTLPPFEEDQLTAPLSKLTISGAVGDESLQDKASKRSGPPCSKAVDQAEHWVAQWRASRPDGYVVKASHAQLRAYALWHQQGLKCKDVAVLLRDTPLSLQTVSTYVLEAIRHENLEYDAEHVREPLGILPVSVHRRYGKILEETAK